jgi:hypothetical protein
MLKYLTGIRLLVAVTAVLLAGCGRKPLEPEITLPTATVSGLTARYMQSQEIVRLTWQKPVTDVEIAGYRLYRTSTVGPDGVPTDFISQGSRLWIHPDSTSFDDIVGLAVGTYYYLMTAVTQQSLVRDVLYDTVLCNTYSIECSIDECDTVSGESRTAQEVFTVCDTVDSFVVIDTLYNEGDPGQTGTGKPWASVYVGSEFAFSINNGAIFTAKDTCDLVVYDVFRKVKSLRFANGDTPVFGSQQPLGVSYDEEIASHVARWVLKKGPGTKRVHAELTFDNGEKDTIRDDIGIRPYRIDMKIRNESRKGRRSMTVGREYVSERRDFFARYVIGKPYIEFSVNTFGDSTFMEQFEYWIVVTASAGDSWLKQRGKKYATPVRIAQLTGVGPNHNDRHIYRFSFDPDRAVLDPTSESAVNLAHLRDANKGSIEPGTQNQYYANFQKLTALDHAMKRDEGVKEFAIVMRMKGRYFGEERVIASSARLDSKGSMQSYLDFYPPSLRRHGYDFMEYETWDDGDDVKGSFNIRLERAVDGGDTSGADVKAIDLIIAAMPEELAEQWGDDPLNPAIEKLSAGLTLQQLMGYRHRIIPYPIAAPENPVDGIFWSNIDVSAFPAGPYLVGFITEDEFGNRGIAPLDHRPPEDLGRKTQPNPYHLNFVSGDSEL